MEYFLYKFERAGRKTAAAPGIPGEVVDFSIFSSRWLFQALRAGGIKYLKALFLATWAVFVRAAKPDEFRVYGYLSGGGAILHYSIVSPTSLHMPWLNESEQGKEVGGCLTIATARGNRIYPYVLSRIAGGPGCAVPLYMIVDSSNLASRAGIEKAGFNFSDRLYRKGGFGRPPQYDSRANG